MQPNRKSFHFLNPPWVAEVERQREGEEVQTSAPEEVVGGEQQSRRVQLYPWKGSPAFEAKEPAKWEKMESPGLFDCYRCAAAADEFLRPVFESQLYVLFRSEKGET